MVDIFVKTARIRSADLRAALSECRQVEQVVVTKNRKRETALERGDVRKLPASNDHVQRFVHISPKALSAAYRQLVNRAGNKPMVDIKI